ncbi:uncharacterized protein LOC129399860 [Sorex araneus]|uniref:uncharacterized protein LOC129399860 n=1 Tax=Sorex araneus TaxID=42254 RepID=UPI002433F052|nr:uncharacterized protein LOC129399860 [Sorex araneus]
MGGWKEGRRLLHPEARRHSSSSARSSGSCLLWDFYGQGQDLLGAGISPPGRRGCGVQQAEPHREAESRSPDCTQGSFHLSPCAPALAWAACASLNLDDLPLLRSHLFPTSALCTSSSPPVPQKLLRVLPPVPSHGPSCFFLLPQLRALMHPSSGASLCPELPLCCKPDASQMLSLLGEGSLILLLPLPLSPAPTPPPSSSCAAALLERGTRGTGMKVMYMKTIKFRKVLVLGVKNESKV